MRDKRSKRRNRHKVIPILLLIPITYEWWVNHSFRLQLDKCSRQDYNNWRQGVATNDEK